MKSQINFIKSAIKAPKGAANWSKSSGAFSSTPKRLTVLLIVLFIIIIGLVIAVVAVNMTRGGEEDVQGTAELVESDDIEATVLQYQEYIDAASDNESKAALLQKRLNYTLKNDLNKVYGEVAVADAVKIDEIIKTVDSAGQVFNVSMYYEDEEVSSEYAEIISERQAESGEEDYTDGEG